MKLLYAEDERGLSEAVVDILTYHKYIVDAVYDGAEALAFAQNEQYDGIILDIMMPKLSGLEVLRRLRSEGCRTPILLLTAKGEVEDQVQGLDLGGGRLPAQALLHGAAAGPDPGHAAPPGDLYAQHPPPGEYLPGTSRAMSSPGTVRPSFCPKRSISSWSF